MRILREGTDRRWAAFVLVYLPLAFGYLTCSLFSRTGLVPWIALTVLAVAGCGTAVPARRDSPTVCVTRTECDARDGERVAIVGMYRYHPDLPGIDYTAASRAVRIALDDGTGPYLEPFWKQRAVRSPDERARYLGKRVRVVGRYHAIMPRNPDDPPQASAMGGACIEVETIELVP